MKDKCFGLVRVSSENQENNTSLNNQRQSIKKYCKYHDIQLVEVVEEVYSGYKNDRDSIQYLKDKVESGECDSIIIYRVDRIMRSFSEGVVFIKFLMDNDVSIISVSEELNTKSTSGKFYINLLLSLSELERNTIVERLKIGRMNNFKNKKRHSGRVCFGYEKSENGLVVNENESKIVKYIFKKWSEINKLDITKTKKTQKLLKLLKSRNYDYRGENFKSYHLSQILRNSFYCGVLSHKNDTTRHSYDTIISQRLYNIVN